MMGEIRYAAQHPCVSFLVCLSVTVSSPGRVRNWEIQKLRWTATMPLRHKSPQRPIHNPHVCSRYHPIPYGVRGREQAAGCVEKHPCG
jgi:hypothetical protein